MPAPAWRRYPAFGALASTPTSTTSSVAAMLYSTSPYDPVVLAAGAAGLAALGIAASSIPAWRASRVDPMVALRAD